MVLIAIKIARRNLIMAKTEVRCPVCGTNFVIGNSGNAVTELSEGIHYLVPETIRNENVSNKDAKVNERLEALKEAGINVDKLRDLMGGNSSFKDIFEEDDPIIKELSESGFIRNKELFRRWICAQTFRLLKDPKGWTHAVRNRFDLHYVYRQTLNELALLRNLERKGLKGKDKRFDFFTFDDLKSIFSDLCYYTGYTFNCDERRNKIKACSTYNELLNTVTSMYWKFSHKCTARPRAWLNCFKGAGAYYTLQNLIRTHGLILPKCINMDESLTLVENIYKDIIRYKPAERRWDILMSLLNKAVIETHFELKY
jgi:hypothetical protein